MDKFDLILLYCFSFAVYLVTANFYCVIHEFEQFSAGVWTFATAAVTGEIVMFSLYQIAKKKNLSIPKFTRGKHQSIDEMESENEKTNQS